jgi:hypothetical protein
MADDEDVPPTENSVEPARQLPRHDGAEAKHAKAATAPSR